MSRKHTGEMEVYVHSFLTSAVDGRTCATWRPDRFTLRKWTPVPTEQKGRCSPTAGLCEMDKWQNLLGPAGNSKDGLSSTQNCQYPQLPQQWYTKDNLFIKLFFVIFALCNFQSALKSHPSVWGPCIYWCTMSAKTSVQWSPAARCQWVGLQTHAHKDLGAAGLAW